MTPTWKVTIPFMLAALFALHGALRAQSVGGPFELTAEIVALGGGRSAGGGFVLEGTVGQHAVGAPASGGAHVLIPGFRRQRVAAGDELFSNGFESP